MLRRRVGCLLVAWWSLRWIGWVGRGRLLGGRRGVQEVEEGEINREEGEERGRGV